MRLLTALFFIFFLKLCCQEVPHLDSLGLGNGLKVYLLQCGEAPVLNVRLVINGGKRNETSCQVGYSDVVQLLLNDALKQSPGLKEKNKISCEMNHGQTVINTNCLMIDFNKTIDLISTGVAKLSFRHDKMHRAVASVADAYTLENISVDRLSGLYRDLAVYGTKNPIGRNYCQYQLQKAIPAELRQFYFKYYTPASAVLLICGNFNVNEIKRTIAKYFYKWKAIHKEKKRKPNLESEPPKIRGWEISFVNKRDAPGYLLKWVLPAPPSRSADYRAFRTACNLFEQYLADQIKENTDATDDSLRIKTAFYPKGLMELECTVGQHQLVRVIQQMDSALKNFCKQSLNETSLTETTKSLRDDYFKESSPETMSARFDPLLYGSDPQMTWLRHTSAVPLTELQEVQRQYFNAGSYKLIIIGQEHKVSAQLSALKNVDRYETMDFETCDESCIVYSKKKWKKGRSRCCFQCFLKGWCPCMYSSDRLQ